MLYAIQGLKLYAHCYTSSEALYMQLSVMLTAIHGVTLCADCYTWSEALCSLLYME